MSMKKKVAASKTNLSTIIELLGCVAPLEGAEEWDNVGLLVEPLTRQSIDRVLLTIDLTTRVMEEALRSKTGLIVAYHPPLFHPVLRLSRLAAKDRILMQAIRSNIAIYSPHTALDTVEGGVTDWLCGGLGKGKARPIPSETNSFPGTGPGRVFTLARPASLPTLVRRVKKHLETPSLRLVTSPRHTGRSALIRSIAACPGAGASVVSGVPADVYLTGEMKHHEALAALEAGTSVILCEHSRSERGYLPVLKKRMQAELPGLRIAVSKADREPVETV
jgi:dinuclear metal center YbgI/SA1388 family protein